MRTENEQLNEAMRWAYTQKNAPGSTVDYAESLVICLAAEVERLRARLSDAEAENQLMRIDRDMMAISGVREIPSAKALLDRVDAAEAVNAAKDGVIAEQARRLGEAQKSQEFTSDWYKERFERMDHWMRNRVPSEVKNEYFSIQANGIPTPWEKPLYVETIHGLKLQAKAAEAQVESMRKERDEEAGRHAFTILKWQQERKDWVEGNHAVRKSLEDAKGREAGHRVALELLGDIARGLRKCRHGRTCCVENDNTVGAINDAVKAIGNLPAPTAQPAAEPGV